MVQTRQPVGSLTKVSLAEAFAKRMDLSNDDAIEYVENLFDLCAQTVASGKAISISNFGTFERVTRSSKYARNPQTGDRVLVPERQAVRFVVSPRLNMFANSDTPELATIKKKPKGPKKK